MSLDKDRRKAEATAFDEAEAACEVGEGGIAKVGYAALELIEIDGAGKVTGAQYLESVGE